MYGATMRIVGAVIDNVSFSAFHQAAINFPMTSATTAYSST